MYMKGLWDIQVGYKVLPLWWVDWKKALVDYQLANDCCELCIASAVDQDFTIVSYGTQTNIPNPCSPYAPQWPGSCKICTHDLLGDFNDDFNNDFYIN